MSEDLKGAGSGNTAWDNMSENPDNEIDIEALLAESGPEAVLKSLYESGDLTIDTLEEWGPTIRQYGDSTTEGLIEEYDELLRKHGSETPEEVRKLDDERPEQEGFETKMG